jgi:hypothetical protein
LDLSNHPLGNLGDGFRIKETFDPITTSAVVFSTVPAFIQIGPAAPQFRPLRDAIPYTKGRLEAWKLVEHVRSAKARNWPGIKPSEFLGQSIAICGGGPSLASLDQLKELRALQKKGTKVLAINRTHDFLLTKGVVPWAGILLDPVPAVASYITPRRGIRYYVGSQCHPSTFDNFDKPDVQKYIWHAASVLEMDAELTAREMVLRVPANGSTCGLRSILKSYIEGFREIHLFGFDSCMEQNADGTLKINDGKPNLHAYPKPEAILDVKEMLVPMDDGDRTYYGNTMMFSQADEFQQFLLARDQGLQNGMLEPHTITVHGSGLIPDIARFYGLHSDQLKVKHGKRLHA